MKKIAVILPGLGYKIDRSLLYFSKKIAESKGYETFPISYSNFPRNVEIEMAIETGLQDLKNAFSQLNLEPDTKIVFIGKSIGTAIASRFLYENKIKALQVIYTPIPLTFQNPIENAIVFSGTKDPWFLEKQKLLTDECNKNNIQLYLYEEANHSLETGNVKKDIENLAKIMDLTQEFIELSPEN